MKLPSTPVGLNPPPLGLVRLQSSINAAKFDLDPLDVRSGDNGLHKKNQDGVGYAALDGGGQWTRPLRSPARNVLFVSFLVDASVGSTIDVGGARLRVSGSENPNYAELEVSEGGTEGTAPWRKLYYRVPLEVFDGRSLAVLPLVTLRLDRANGKWDFYSGFYRIAQGLTLIPAARKAASQLVLQAGDGGALICGAVISEENPLFADADTDGMEDGQPVPAKAADDSLADKGVKEPKASPVPSFPILHLIRPLPDRIAKVSRG